MLGGRLLLRVRAALCAVVRRGRVIAATAALLCFVNAVVAPPAAYAGVQLTSFSVTSPPPPETEPAPRQIPHPLVVTASADLPTHDATIGSATGTAGTSGGGATYTVSIVVPPGRAGMQPALSLNYNSRSGNGPMGVGWSLSGLSSIHRCPQTSEQDGQTVAVSYAASDRLCLDGQRLVLTNGSSSITYGAATAQYDTEVTSYARITQVGNITDDTGCFKVEQKDGRIFHYGGVVSADGKTCAITTTPHSRVKPNATTPLSWLIEKIEDRAGNYETFAYHDYTNGEVLIQTITYTLPDSTTTLDRTVSFAYQARTSAPAKCATDSTKCATDVSSSYLAGSGTMQTQALASITTAVGGTTVRTYTPSYSAAAYSGRLLMNSLTECAYSGTSSACHPATTFVYNDSALNFKLKPLGTNIGLPAAYVSSTAPIQTQPNQFSMIADLDGDGTREAAAVVPLSDTKHYYLIQLTGDRAAQSVIDLTGTGYTASLATDFDVDGSGRSALIQSPVTSGDDPHLSLNTWIYGRGVVYTPPVDVSGNQNAAANFSALFQHYATAIPVDVTKPPHSFGAIVSVADLDADGKPDLIVVQQDTTCGQNDAVGPQDGVFFYRNITSGILSSSNPPKFTIPSGHLFCLSRTVPDPNDPSTYAEETVDHIGDFDGDGIPDFFLSNHDSRSIPTTIIAPTFSAVLRTKPGAVGVTRTNPLTCDPSAINNNTASKTDECYGQHGYATFWLDVNGDGLEDFVIARPYSTENDANNNPLPPTWRVRLNQGGGVLGGEINTLSTDGLITDGIGSFFGSNVFRYANKLPPMDVDSDGKPDLVIPSASQGFAVKMCTLHPVSKLNNGEGCPAAGSQPFLSNAPATSTSQCGAWSCPEEIDSHTLNMPPNASGVTPAFPAQWQDVAPGSNSSVPVLPAFGAYTTAGGGADNSVYHLAALKFVQTDATHIKLQRVETPAIARLADQSTAPQDLFGDGLADLTTSIGCTNQPTQVATGTGSTSSLFTSNVCAVVSDSANQYGPSTALDDGSAPCTANADGTCYFDNHPVLYASINQGTLSTGGSTSSLAVAGAIKQPAAPRVKQASTATPLLPTPVLPGLMDAAVNGVGDVAVWGYLPLSVPENTYGFPLYSVQGDYSDDRYYYFQSSMPVVYAMVQHPGVGANTAYEDGGFRSAAYGYAQAMYNHYGRGFTGFNQIISQEYVTTGTLSSRAEKTVTTYHQKFPLVGKVQTIQRYDATTGTQIAREDDGYVCGTARTNACPEGTAAAKKVYAPVLDTQTLKAFDLKDASQYSQTDTVNGTSTTSGWDAFGNLTYRVVTHSDKGSSLFVDSHQTITTNTYAPNAALTGCTDDSASWWINKLCQTSVMASITYNANHPIPSVASAPSQTVTTNFTWNTDRTPASRTVQPGTTNQQSITTYSYPTTSYGLPNAVTICLGSYDSKNNCNGASTVTGGGDPGAALSPLRTMQYTYTKDGSTSAGDGYFVLSTTDALSHPTMTLHQTSDGQVYSTTDPNNTHLLMTYDVFGRPTEVDHTGSDGGAIESAIQRAYVSCLDTSVVPPNLGHCPTTDADSFAEDTNEKSAAYRITAVQNGYPTQVAWFDLLGRKIKQGHRGFDGTFIASLTDYDELGTTLDQSTPYKIGDTPFLTSWNYDTLGRPTMKIAAAADPPSNHGDLETDYQYSGRQTSQVVHDTQQKLTNGTCTSANGSLCLASAHYTNALGQVMQVTESPILNGTPTTLTTNYWTEPLGHVAAIKDAEHNVTYASYNALGQRTSSNDPDQGNTTSWTFNYDALGELVSQTDARGVVTTVNKRDALGRVKEQQQVPPSVAPTGFQNETVLDDWSYDPTGGTGELGAVQRCRASGNTVPSPTTCTPVWQESYTYESTTARLSTISTTIQESGRVVLSSAMGYDTSGRPSTHTYPGSPPLTVTSNYTAYGQLASLSNTQTVNGSPVTKTYWTATAENEWDHVTGETFIDGTTGAHKDYHSTGQTYQLNWGSKDSYLYGYDAFGNLVSQSRTGTSTNAEAYAFDPLQRLTTATRNVGAAVNYAYTASGNLAKKDDYSTTSASAYTYASANSTTNNCGPHAVNTVALPGRTATYQCDLNGNVIDGTELSGKFDADNHPRTLSRHYTIPAVEPCRNAAPSDTIFCDGYETLQPSTATGTTNWAYDSNGQRYYETSSSGTRYYGPAGYEQSNGNSLYELGPVIVKNNNAQITVVLRDRLGSTLDTVDGGTPTQRAFDAFGKARNGDMSDRPNGTLNLNDTIHGFTDHTHADDVALVHMNGRVFDPNLGRFLSVDPLINHPMSSQGLNPYSYIRNNPLSGTDPSGYADETPAPVIGTICGAMAQGSNCPGVSSTQVGSASLTDQRNAFMAQVGQIVNNMVHVVADSGSVSMTSTGAGALRVQAR